MRHLFEQVVGGCHSVPVTHVREELSEEKSSENKTSPTMEETWVVWEMLIEKFLGKMPKEIVVKNAWKHEKR